MSVFTILALVVLAQADRTGDRPASRPAAQEPRTVAEALAQLDRLSREGWKRRRPPHEGDEAGRAEARRYVEMFRGRIAPGLDRYHFAQILLRAGDTEAALAELDAYIEDASKFADATLLRARMLVALGRLDDAQTTLESAEPLLARDSRLGARAAMRWLDVARARDAADDDRADLAFARALALAAPAGGEFPPFFAGHIAEEWVEMHVSRGRAAGAREALGRAGALLRGAAGGGGRIEEMEDDLGRLAGRIDLLDRPLRDVAVDRVVNGAFDGFEALRGQVVLVEVWAPSFPPCREDLQQIRALTAAHADVRVLLISRWHESDPGDRRWRGRTPDQEALDVAAALRADAVPWPLLLVKGRSRLNDLGLRTLPARLVLDREGRIRLLSNGRRLNRGFEAALAALLAE